MAQPVGRSTDQPQKLLRKCEQCESTDKKLSRCARCHIVMYCGLECQKAHWPTHKLVCIAPPPKPEAPLDPVIAQKIAQAAFLPFGQKDFAIEGIAKELLKSEQYAPAFQLIRQHVSLPPVIIKFFQSAAAQMLKNVQNISQVKTFGQELKLDAKRIRQTMVEALATNGHIKEACEIARSTDYKEHSFLLEIVASALMIEKKYSEAQVIALTIPDPGMRKDLLQMISPHIK